MSQGRCVYYENLLKNGDYFFIENPITGQSLTDEQKKNVLNEFAAELNRSFVCNGTSEQVAAYLRGSKNNFDNSALVYNGLKSGQTIEQIQQQYPDLTISMQTTMTDCRYQ